MCLPVSCYVHTMLLTCRITSLCLSDGVLWREDIASESHKTMPYAGYDTENG